MQAPLIDPRQLNDLVAQMKRMVPFYVPEWRFSPEDPDAAAALFYIFADMYLENVKRLNKVPMKHYMAFLNLMDLRQLSAQPAKARVVFTLSEGMNEPVHIPKGTRVSGLGKLGNDIIYETLDAYMVSPANLTQLINVSKAKDRILSANPQREQNVPFALFADLGENLQRHAFYLRHERMLEIRHGAAVQLGFSNSQLTHLNENIAAYLSNPAKVTWSYVHDQQWVPFERVESGKSGQLILYKTEKQPNTRTSVAGHEGLWIRCALNAYDPADDFLQVMRIDEAKINTSYYETTESRGIVPDLLFNNDLQVSNAGHYPFGEEFQVFSSYYIASSEVFCKTGAQIELTFDVRWDEIQVRPPFEPKVEWKMVMKKADFEKDPPLRTTVAQVAWEYWDGNTWAMLTENPESATVLRFDGETESAVAQVQFQCPADFDQTKVNGHENYWIRMRIVKIDHPYSSDFLYMVPWIAGLGLKYTAGKHVESPELLITENNLEQTDWSQALRLPGKPFLLFEPLTIEQPAVYFGFDLPLGPGMHHLYLAVQAQSSSDLTRQTPLLEWETAKIVNAEIVWEPIKVLDGTQSFTTSGFIKLILPETLQTVQVMNQTCCWIRAVNRDQQYEQSDSGWRLPVVRTMLMNAVDVIQRESIRGEYLEELTDQETFETYFKLKNTPVSDVEIWMDETETIPEETLQALEASSEHRVEVIRDSEEQIMHVWVRWDGVATLSASGANDRHFVVNHTTGQIQFGDDLRGKAPVRNGMNKIRANYHKIEGEAGNLGANEIRTMQHSIAFIESVSNPEPAVGGCQPEAIEDAVKRGPALLQHRNRAVTAKDFEALTREANRNVAKVKCLSRQESPELVPLGSVTLCVQPAQTLAAQADFPEWKKGIEAYLLERCAPFVAFRPLIRIIEPAYLQISVFVRGAVRSTDELYSTEQDVLRKLEAFLDPNTGNFDGGGWAIGETFHQAMLYSLMRTVPQLTVLKQLSFTVHRLENGERHEMDPQQINQLRHGVILNGTHRVIIDLASVN